MIRTDAAKAVWLVVISRPGLSLARRLAAPLAEREKLPVRLLVTDRLADTAPDLRGDAHEMPGIRQETSDGPLTEAVERIWPKAAAIIFIAPAGVAVRTVAMLLREKTDDPAVLCLDDTGRFCISLTGGHVAGGNRLAECVAGMLGAQAVVTSSAEGHRLPSLDMLGRQAGWQVESTREALKLAQAALIEGQAIGLWQQAGQPLACLAEWENHPGCGENRLLIYDSRAAMAAALQRGQIKAALLVSDLESDTPDLPQISPEESDAGGLPCILYRPRTLVAGVGCERGVSAGEIEHAVAQACRQAGVNPRCVTQLASIDLKQAEEGLLAYARQKRCDTVFYSAGELSAAAEQYRLPSRSETVRRAVGTPSVAEAACVLASGSQLLAAKTVHGRVTVALARLAESRLRRRQGCLHLVGIGPGRFEMLTGQALRALQEAEIIVGYRAYIDQLRAFLPEKTYEESPITEERRRVERAVQLADAGHRVALVSSGDAGVYGMAGLAYEVLDETGWDGAHPRVEVIPGLTASLVAGALVGAPLMSDFCTISLSDLLTPVQVIMQRIEAAAAADLVTVFYNPQSRTRRRPLRQALEILTRHRTPQTPAAIVRHAGRPGQQVRITTLEQLTDHEWQAVDMNTLLIIGNSATRLLNGRLVTRRGYSVHKEENVLDSISYDSRH